MIEGKEFHFDEERKVLRRKTLAGGRREVVKALWSKVYVVPERLGLYGVIDEVAEARDGLVVVENKYMRSPRKPYSGHVYQAAAYAILAEEYLHRVVKRIVIRYVRDGRSFEIPMTEDLRRHVLWTISKIKSIIEGERIPREVNHKKCKNCGFRKICKGA